MDLVTHSLCGLAIWRLGFAQRLSARRGVGITLLAANAPDVDILWRFLGDEAWHFHRGTLTHTLLAILALGAVTALSERRATPVLLALLCGLSHLILDVMSTSGAPVVWPLADRRWALDWLTPTDPFLWMILLVAQLAPLLRTSPHKVAAVSVWMAGVYVGLQGAAHGVAVKRAAVWARQEGFEAQMTQAFPETPGGLYWNTVAFNEDELVQRPVDLWGPARGGFRFPRGLEEPLVEEFLDAEVGRRWAVFARIPVADSEVRPDGRYEVWLRDMRFLNRFTRPEQGVPFDLRGRFDGSGALVEHTLFVPGHPSDGPVPLPVRSRIKGRG